MSALLHLAAGIPPAVAPAIDEIERLTACWHVLDRLSAAGAERVLGVAIMEVAECLADKTRRAYAALAQAVQTANGAA